MEPQPRTDWFFVILIVIAVLSVLAVIVGTIGQLMGGGTPSL